MLFPDFIFNRKKFQYIAYESKAIQFTIFCIYPIQFEFYNYVEP